MVNINKNDQNGNLISVQISGELTGDDYKTLNPSIDKKLKENDKISILFEFENFDKIDLGSVWQALKFDTSQRDEVERIAVIGNKKTGHGLETIEENLTSAETKFFVSDEKDRAYQWVSNGTNAN